VVAVNKGGTGLTSAGTNGQVLTSTGSGTLTWTGGTHTIGESFGGGTVFFVSTDSQHGLIAETTDQSSSCSWYSAQDVISTSTNHSTEGKKYTDWRLPTKNELNLLNSQKSVVGGFTTTNYWSSTESDATNAWYQNFNINTQTASAKTGTAYVRAIRAF